MDLLGSILNSMDKPPSVSDKQRDLIKKQKEEMVKKQNREKQKLDEFRAQIEARVTKFMRDEDARSKALPPMDQIQRSVVHDVAEVAGLVAVSVGEEGEDRHIVLFKRDGAPCEAELAALRRGDTWDPVAHELNQQKAAQQEAENEIPSKPFTPATNYKEKYQHLIGRESAKEAARVTQTNTHYGNVPSKNKKDQRSIEQTLADIQTAKRLKTAHNSAAGDSEKPAPV